MQMIMLPTVIAYLLALVVGVVTCVIYTGLAWIGYKYFRIPKGYNMRGGIYSIVACAIGFAAGVVALNLIDEAFLGMRSNVTLLCFVVGVISSHRFMIKKILGSHHDKASKGSE